MSEIESVINTKESCDVEQDVISNEENHCAAVQTRAMKVIEGKPQKPLKVTTIHGLEIGPEQLIEQQKTDQTLKKYWELAENPVENGKAQFFIKNKILYRKYFGKHDGEGIIQVVVPENLREKVVSLAHDTLRGSTKTLNRVLQEFYWPGINKFVLRYMSSCDLCQRNVSKSTVGKAPLGSLSVIGTPFSVVCIDLIGPLSPPSDGNIVHGPDQISVPSKVAKLQWYCFIVYINRSEIKYDPFEMSSLTIISGGICFIPLHCVPKNVHLFIFRITLSKIKRF